MFISQKQLKFLIDQKEGYNLEFKESFSEGLSKEICAFANANGGKILLGISDNGNIKGIRITNRLKSQIHDLARNFDPQLSLSLKESNDVLVIVIPEGKDKPYSTNGRYYLRNGSNSQQMSRDEIREFFQKEGLIHFDEKPNKTFHLVKDFDKVGYQYFLKEAGISSVIKKDDLLDNLELLEGKYLRNAGVMLFCKKITKHIRNATVSCIVFQGTTKYKIIDSKEFAGNLYANYEDVINYLKSKLNTEYIIKGGPREEVLELPEDALREALLNAMGHRNYFLTGNIQVYIFSDRVEFVSPGGLVSGMKMSDLGKKSMPRNVLLFGLLQRMDLVEKAGSGILRIKQSIKDYRLPASKIEVDENWFTVTFIRPDLQKQSYEERKGLDVRWVEVGGSPESSPKGAPKSSPKTEEEIIRLIQGNNRITTQIMADTLGLTKRAILKQIDKLKKRGILKRVGPAKGGYWKILGDG